MKKKIAVLGMGAWGFCLASLLANKESIDLICWTTRPEMAHYLTKTREHPLFPGHSIKDSVLFTTDLSQAIHQADLIVESVTSAGLRPVLEHIRSLEEPQCPVVITSKGIEQDTGLILPEVALEVLGKHHKKSVGCLSGPSFAQEVINALPTSVVASGYSQEVIKTISEVFSTPYFRVYPNTDLMGVAFGGALKNIIAIACGISDGLKLGASSKAALMTRGLHEINKLAVKHGCRTETIYGLAGMGDLCLTCSSPLSRNYRFGSLLAEGIEPKEAQKKIGMVVEGSYTVVSALQLSKHYRIEIPITQIIHSIIYDSLPPKDAVQLLMQRAIKEEHL